MYVSIGTSVLLRMDTVESQLATKTDVQQIPFTLNEMVRDTLLCVLSTKGDIPSNVVIEEDIERLYEIVNSSGTGFSTLARLKDLSKYVIKDRFDVTVNGAITHASLVGLVHDFNTVWLDFLRWAPNELLFQISEEYLRTYSFLIAHNAALTRDDCFAIMCSKGITGNGFTQ